jgi:hypothetical protein
MLLIRCCIRGLKFEASPVYVTGAFERDCPRIIDTWYFSVQTFQPTLYLITISFSSYVQNALLMEETRELIRIREAMLTLNCPYLRQ